jgi:hypothetical protein
MPGRRFGEQDCQNVTACDTIVVLTLGGRR